MQKKLQVFVSSTFTDLIEERQAAVAAILKAGHIPAGMELFTSGDQSQMDVIRRWIDESDIYLLIVGGRYGSIEKNTGVSYTELEFDCAVNQEKPLFSVVATEECIDEKVKIMGKSVIETENPTLFKQFKDKVLSNVSSFFSDEKDVRLAVYESLSDLAVRPDLVGWVRSSEVLQIEKTAAEIEQLQSENQRLRDEISKLKSKSVNKSGGDFQELTNTLGGIEVKIPEDLRSDPENDKRPLLDLFINNRDSLVAGVTDSPFNDPSAQFLYYNVATKLKVHGLVGDKRLVGKRISCLATTVLGDSYLAWVDKRIIENKKKKD